MNLNVVEVTAPAHGNRCNWTICWQRERSCGKHNACDIYLASTDTNLKASLVERFNCPPELVHCGGCKGDRQLHWSPDCWILHCCVDEKGLEFCTPYHLPGCYFSCMKKAKTLCKLKLRSYAASNTGGHECDEFPC